MASETSEDGLRNRVTVGRELTVKSHDRRNLFARLPRAVALEFAHDVRSKQDQNKRASSYSYALEREDIEFLVLEIAREDGSCIYVSYNGGDVDEDDLDDDAPNKLPCIELAASIISSNNLPTVVSVRPLSRFSTASELVLQALSEQDYSHISRFSDWLEQGGLLQQVSVVYRNQILCLHVDETQFHLQVLTDEQRTVEETEGFPLDPSDGERSGSLDDTLELPRYPLCWRLVADTELTILPPPLRPCPAIISCRLYPSKLDYPCISSLPTISQGCALFHPQYREILREAIDSDQLEPSPMYVRITMSSIGHSNASPHEAPVASSRILRFETSEQVPKGWVVLHPCARMELDLDLAKDAVTVDVVSQSDMVSLCATARFMGVRLQAATFQWQQTQPPWRYPRNWPVLERGIESNAGNCTFDPGLFDNMANDETPIKLNSLFGLPWTLTLNRQPFLYRALLRPGDGGSSGPSAADDLYIFARDLRRMLRTSPWQSEATGDAHRDLFLQQESFSLAGSLQGRTLYCSALLEATHASARSVLLCGGVSSGKTSAALVLAAKLSLDRHVVYVDCRRLRETKGMRLQMILQELETLLAEAKRNDKSLIILENLDELMINYANGGPETGSSHAVLQNPVAKDECLAIEGLLSCCLEEHGNDIKLVVTSDEFHSLPISFLNAVSIDSVIKLPLLGADDRRQLFLDFLMIDNANAAATRDEVCGVFPDLARSTTAFRPGDLERVASRTTQLLRSGHSLANAAHQALELYTPLSKISALSEHSRMKHGWAEVGGLFDVKRELSSIILRPSSYSRIYDKASIRLPRGILLFGPSGTGKSFIVPALAKKCGFPLIVCRGPELLSKYIGASESKVRELFTRAAAVAPSILFLDELDALAPRRGSDSTGVTDRVVNQLLTFLDGVEESGTATGTVYIVAASSRPDKIDPALLRPGRLERHVYVGNPRTVDEWTDLILQTAWRYEASDSVRDYILSGRLVHDLRTTAHHAFYFTAADANAVFHSAQVIAVHETVALGRDVNQVSLRYEHVLEAFRSTRPSLSMDGWQRLESVYESFRGNYRETRRDQLAQEPLRVALR